MSYLVISSSLNPGSRSRALAQRAHLALQELGEESELIDLQCTALPMCDAAGSYAHPNVIALRERIQQADGILFATPVYNYAASASAKNLLELTGSAWTQKVVGFLCAAGGRHSYMSIMGLANSLMLDFRVLVIPRFVYSVESDFSDSLAPSDEVVLRVEQLAGHLVATARAFALVQSDTSSEP